MKPDTMASTRRQAAVTERCKFLDRVSSGQPLTEESTAPAKKQEPKPVYKPHYDEVHADFNAVNYVLKQVPHCTEQAAKAALWAQSGDSEQAIRRLLGFGSYILS